MYVKFDTHDVVAFSLRIVGLRVHFRFGIRFSEYQQIMRNI